MRHLLLLTLLLAPVADAHAQQPVTTQDIVQLTKAGLSEEVLLALIEVHRPVFPVDTATLKGLKDSGVAPNVIVAMIRSGRELPLPPVAPEQTAPEAQPPVVYVEPERHDEPPSRPRYEEYVREVIVPVYVPVYSGRSNYSGYSNYPDYSRPIVRPDHKPAEPVYWGWGGKPRPDGWKTAADLQKDAKIPREPQRK